MVAEFSPFFKILIYPYILISCDKVGTEFILITISDSSCFGSYLFFNS